MRTSRIPQMPRQSNTDIRPRDSAEKRLAALADDFDVPNNSVLEFFGCHECLLAGLDEARDNAPTCGGGRADHPSQRRRLLEDAVADIPMQYCSVPAWTLIFNSDSRSCASWRWSRRLLPGSKSTNRSRSLDSVASPRATEPNILTRRTP